LGLLGIRQSRREYQFAKLREDFVVSVSHELRTPLAQIRLSIETVLLGRGRSTEEEKQFLSTACRETIRLGHMVDNILDFSKAEHGRLTVVLEPRRLAPITRASVDAFAPMAASRRIRVVVAADEEAAAAVDAPRFQQCVLNLLDNAVKYGPEDSEVKVGLRKVNNQVHLSVEDSGPGVPVSHRESIFLPFERVAGHRSTSVAGAGLGLAIVREIVTLHHGSCRVEDRSDGGARFVIALPSAEAVE
jgi:signal transduction histidine kinase